MNTEQLRAEFEEWLDEQMYPPIKARRTQDFRGCKAGDYFDDRVQVAWTAAVMFYPKGRHAGMTEAVEVVIQNTAIPKDAKNPTCDNIVILGEKIAGQIEAARDNRAGRTPACKVGEFSGEQLDGGCP